jgi:hypothetical protein
MKPKFANEQAWHQAEILMQPAYIRLVDQIRRQTEEHEREIQVSYEEVSTPYPSNLLCLQPQMRESPADRSNRSNRFTPDQTQPLLKVDIWDLCFQVCFEHYEPLPVDQPEQLVAIDTSLFDPDSQEIDWNKLDHKAQNAVRQVFARFKLLSTAP